MCVFKNRLYPCGHCYECLSKIRNDWSIRLQAEWNSSKSAYHAILTYSDANLPKSPNGLATVRKKDFINFMKRLRHHFKEKIKFFAVSEYGGFTQRPHYHVIFFNVPVFDDLQRFECYDVSEKMRSHVQSAWNLGEVRKRSSYVVSGAQLHYLLKDLYNWYEPEDLFNVYERLHKDKSKSRMLENFKRNTFNPFIKCGKDDDREKNFRLMSKNLGLSFLDELKKSVTDSLDFDFYMSWYSPYIQNKFANKDRNWFFNKQREFYAKLDYDDKGRVLLPGPFANNRDFVELLQERFDNFSRKKTLQTVRYAIPKYYRQRLFSRGFRELLNHNRTIDRYDDWQTYVDKYGEYDRTHDLPMFLEIAKRDWRLYASRHKDFLTTKFLNNEYL